MQTIIRVLFSVILFSSLAGCRSTPVASLPDMQQVPFTPDTVAYLIQCAEKGDPRAQFLLGEFYSNYDATRSVENAEKWYRLAAERGHAGAMFGLGKLLRKQPDSRAEARSWFEKAYAQGVIPAAKGVAFTFFEGAESQEAGNAWAKKYYEANRNFLVRDERRASHNLAACSQYGFGTEENLDMALAWRLKAAKDETGMDMPHHDVFAERLLPLAEAGDSAAQFLLGSAWQWRHIYVLPGEEPGDPKADAEVAKMWYLKAAEQGHAGAQFSLGQLLFLSAEANSMPEALRWFAKAAQNGSRHGVAGVMMCYEKGPQANVRQALKWRKKKFEAAMIASKRNDLQGHFDLAFCYENGIGVKRNPRKAAKIYMKMVKNGAAYVNFLQPGF